MHAKQEEGGDSGRLGDDHQERPPAREESECRDDPQGDSTEPKRERAGQHQPQQATIEEQSVTTTSKREDDWVRGPVTRSRAEAAASEKAAVSIGAGKEGGDQEPAITASNDDVQMNQERDEDMNDNNAKEKEAKISHRPQTLEESFTQLRALMEGTDKMPLGGDWPERAAAMFETVYHTTPIKEKPQKADDGYPELGPDEALELMKLFKWIAVRNKRPSSTWKKCLTDLSRDLHRSTWTVTALIRKSIDQARLEPERGSSVWGQTQQIKPTSQSNEEQSKFTFSDGTFRQEQRDEIIAHCRQQFEFPIALREPTELEWVILQGLMEGKIIARHLPQFLRRICDADTLLRFQNTIVAQVEGELIGRLQDNTPVYRDHQSSNRIVEAVMQAARHRGGKSEKLYEMMKELKAAAYNPATHALHFVFFNRETAAKWNSTTIPFRMQLVKLSDPNATQQVDKPEQSVWERQLGADGIQNATTYARYRVQLLNVSRFVDITRLTEFLRHETGSQFYAYSLDAYGPRSTSSLTWELLFDATVCPTKLTDILRINWMGHLILVHHVSRQRQQPCLGCGRPGHIARFCKTLDSDLTNKNCVMATEELMKDIPHGPQTFRSMEEVKDTLKSRTAIKTSTNSDREAASIEKREQQDRKADMKNKNGAAEKAEAREIWKTQGNNQKKKTTPKKSPQTEQKKEEKAGSELEQPKDKADASRTNDKSHKANTQAPLEQPKTPHATKSSQSGSLITQEGMAWAKTLQKFRGAIGHQRQVAADEATDINPYTNEAMTEDEGSFDDLKEALGLVESRTPATGNCQYYAIAEAALQQPFETSKNTNNLVAATRAIKKGIQAAAGVHFEHDFKVAERKDLLKRLNRWRDGMSDKDTARATSTFFEDVALSGSGREQVINRTVWGGPETLTMAAKALNTPIFLAVKSMQEQKHTFTVYRPVTRTIMETSILTAGEFFKKRDEWVEELRAAREVAVTNKEPLPMVLRYANEHYSSLLYTKMDTKRSETTFVRSSLQTKTVTENENEEKTTKGFYGDEGEPTMDLNDHRDEDTTNNTTKPTENEEKQNGKEDEAANKGEAEEWGEDTDDCMSAQENPKVSHHVVSGWERLNESDRSALHNLNLERKETVEEWTRHFRISREALQQWKRDIHEYGQLQSSSSAPPTQESQSEDRDKHDNRRLADGGVQHRDQAAPTAPERKRQVQVIKESWESERTAWEQKSKWDFPALNTGPAVWLKAVRSNGQEVLNMLRRSPGPHVILNHLQSPTIIELTRPLREQLIVRGLAQLNESCTNTLTKAWLSDWLKRIDMYVGGNHKTTMSEAREDWKQLKILRYGENEVLSQCQVANKEKLSRLILCAVLYREEITMLAAPDFDKAVNTYDMVRALQAVMKKSAALTNAFKAGEAEGKWTALAKFFALIGRDVENISPSVY